MLSWTAPWGGRSQMMTMALGWNKLSQGKVCACS